MDTTQSPISQVTKRLRATSPRSVAIHEEAARVMAAEIVGTVEIACPAYIQSASGSRLTDVDGKEYIDLTMGFGPHVLGHRPAAVEKALADQITRGWHWGIHNPLQHRLGELLVEAAPCGEQVVFCNTGTEATMYAIRAARAFTGKSVVAVFDGSYHGVHDYALLVAERSSDRHAPAPRRRGAGIPSEILETVTMLPYNDEAAFDIIRGNRDRLAAVLVEPVQSSNPRTDIGPWLRGLGDACREAGVLLIVDEVITGFRLAYGGGQEYFDVHADLATYGKALGGGLPIGAVAGRTDVMSVFNTGTGQARPIFSGGTFSGNPLTMAAGIAALTEMRDTPDLYTRLNGLGDRLAEGINRHASRHNMPVTMMNAGSMFHLRFAEGQIRSSRDITSRYVEAETVFYQHLQERGVLVPGIHLAFVSAAHSDADIDAVIAAATASLDALRNDGLI